MIFKDIQGVGGIFSWEVAGIPLHALCLVYMCSMHKMYICVRMHVCLDGKSCKLCTYEELAAKRICYCFKYCTLFSVGE